MLVIIVYYYHSHFTDEKSEAQRNNLLKITQLVGIENKFGIQVV